MSSPTKITFLNTRSHRDFGENVIRKIREACTACVPHLDVLNEFVQHTIPYDRAHEVSYPPAAAFKSCASETEYTRLVSRALQETKPGVTELICPPPPFVRFKQDAEHAVAHAVVRVFGSSGSSEASEASYTPRSILVTGGAGFIASHVVDALVKTYGHTCKITVLDRMDYSASARNLGGVVKLVQGDIRSLDLVSLLLEEEEIDTVMHFAAQTHVDHSFGNSLAFTLDNVYGTHILLEACRDEKVRARLRRFIYVSTDEVYGETDYGVETTHLDPTNPYSAAKASAEMLCKAYITSYHMPIIITRGNNVYGPRQFPEKLVPRFILLAREGKTLPIQGDGSSYRSFLYVEDVAKAFLIILSHGRDGQVYNIGTDKEKSVREVAHDILAYHGVARPEDREGRMRFVRDRAFNDKRYYIGYDKLLALGWPGQETSWEEGLAKTIAWYKSIDPYTYWKKDSVLVALHGIDV